MESGTTGDDNVVFVSNDALVCTGRRYLVVGEEVQFRLASKRGAGKLNKGLLRAVQVEGARGRPLICAEDSGAPNRPLRPR